jgi:hypothetical protein
MCVSCVEQYADGMQWASEVNITLTVERRRACIESVQSDHAAHGGALTRAIWTEKSGYLPGLYDERDIVHRGESAKTLR